MIEYKSVKGEEIIIRFSDNDLLLNFLPLDDLSIFSFKIMILFYTKAEYIYYEGQKGKKVLKNRKGKTGVIHYTLTPFPTDIFFYL